MPLGCLAPGVITLKKSEGVIKISPLCLCCNVAKYRNTFSGVENCRIRFSYSVIYSSTYKITCKAK